MVFSTKLIIGFLASAGVIAATTAGAITMNKGRGEENSLSTELGRNTGNVITNVKGNMNVHADTKVTRHSAGHVTSHTTFSYDGTETTTRVGIRRS